MHHISTTADPAQDVAADRPRCQVCRCALRPLEISDGRAVCVRCEADTDQRLGQVRDLWGLLPGRLMPGTGAPDDPEATRGTADGSKAPCNIDALSLLAGEVSSRLAAHERAWRTALRRDGHWPLAPWRGSQDQAVNGVITWLRSGLGWACHLPADAGVDVQHLHRDLGRLLRRMRQVVEADPRRPRLIAVPCPLYPQDGPDQCGGALVYDPLDAVIRCRACRSTVGYERWPDLGLAAGLLFDLSAAA